MGMAVEGDGRMQRRDGLLGIMGSAPLRPSSFPYGRTVHMRRQMRLAGGMPLKLSGWMWRWCLAGSGAGASPVVHVAIVPAYNVGGGGSVRRSRSTATERTICMGDRRSGEVGRRVNNDARAGAGALDLGPRGAEGRGAAAVFNRTHTRLTARAGTGRGVFFTSISLLLGEVAPARASEAHTGAVTAFFSSGGAEEQETAPREQRSSRSPYGGVIGLDD